MTILSKFWNWIASEYRLWKWQRKWRSGLVSRNEARKRLGIRTGDKE